MPLLRRVRDARAVLAYSEELAQAVMRGEKPLQAALNEALQSQGNLRNERKRLASLKDQRPDLAELVATDALSLEDALAKAKAEAEEHKQQRWAAAPTLRRRNSHDNELIEHLFGGVCGTSSSPHESAVWEKREVPTVLAANVFLNISAHALVVCSAWKPPNGPGRANTISRRAAF